MSAALDGPRIPASGGRATALVVFLHGYGADGNDLIELGRQWRALLPGAAFVSPHAPERCAGAPMGRQWFALSNRPPDDPTGAEDRWNGAVKARGAIDAFLDFGTRAARARRFAPGAGRLQPGLDDGDARRIAAPARSGGDSRLLRPAGRPRAADRGDGARRARRPAADPARPRRPGPAHSGRGDVPGRRGAGAGVDSQPNGTSRSASGTASTAGDCTTADCFSPRR